MSPYYTVTDKLNGKENTPSIRVATFLIEKKLSSFVNCNVDKILVNDAQSLLYYEMLGIASLSKHTPFGDRILA